MAVARITHRHTEELGLAWWRRQHAPLLQLQGRLADFAEIDERMAAYIAGASLDPDTAFAGLVARMNPTAADFEADVFAGLCVLAVTGHGTGSRRWLEAIGNHPVLAPAAEAVAGWLGRPMADGQSLHLALAGGVDRRLTLDDATIEAAPRSHAAVSLRFIDAHGHVLGNFWPGAIAATALPAQASGAQLCSFVLCHGGDATRVRTALEQAIAAGVEPTAVFLAAAASGQAGLLPWLLQAAAMPEMALLALDALRRLSGFDALEAVDLAWATPSAIKRAQFKAAHGAARDWFDRHGADLPDVPCLLGRPRTGANVASVLRHGTQAERELAAMLIVANGGACFPVHARVPVQQAVLARYVPISEPTLSPEAA